MMTAAVLDRFARATALALSQPQRRHGKLLLAPQGDLLVAGDFHHHQVNFRRFQRLADLAQHPQRQVILQELIHGGPPGPQGEDTSFELLVEALDWCLAFPGQVHFLWANHDLAQIQGQAVMKEGGNLTAAFDRYLQVHFGSAAREVAEAYRQWVMSFAVAAMTQTGLFFSHSLPTERDWSSFDAGLLDRPLRAGDLQRGGSLYQLVWGRGHKAEHLKRMAEHWGVEFFINGHQTQDQGWGFVGGRQLILDSAHNHGVSLRVDLSEPCSGETLISAVEMLAWVL